MKNIMALNDTNFERTLQAATLPVLVDFYATWCGPCRMLAPVLEQLAAQMGGEIQFAKVNVDEAPMTAARFRITGVPTLILFRDGKPVDQVEGFMPPQYLAQWLREAAAVRTA
ncbi:MAG: thioredoxin [Verrucomicrobiae bacterium]|nr:thioredoxin [Verrucomicrobiae bacterium]